MRETRQEPPLTRSRTKSVLQERVGSGENEGVTEQGETGSD